jgi:hypothetical protein
MSKPIPKLAKTKSKPIPKPAKPYQNQYSRPKFQNWYWIWCIRNFSSGTEQASITVCPTIRFGSVASQRCPQLLDYLLRNKKFLVNERPFFGTLYA